MLERMSQRHIVQEGLFHVTTNTKGRAPWCTWPGVPEIIIDNLMMTRNVHGAKVYAFCVLPNHVHLIVMPGPNGLSAFMHSFKRNSSKDVQFQWGRAGNRTRAADTEDVHDTIGTSPHLPMVQSTKHHSPRSRGSATPAEEPRFTGWQHGFHDERIRDREQRSHAYRYITENALKHGLVSELEDWPWTSVNMFHMIDHFDW